jgi:ribosome-associated protein
VADPLPETDETDETDGGAVPTADVPEWPVVAARAAASKTDEETIVLDVGAVLSITGTFVITGGRNPRQVKAVAEEVELQVAKAGGPKPVRREGLDALEWVLLDYGDFVVHVFHEETRRYYELERLWSDVPRVEWRPES